MNLVPVFAAPKCCFKVNRSSIMPHAGSEIHFSFVSRSKTIFSAPLTAVLSVPNEFSYSAFALRAQNPSQLHTASLQVSQKPLSKQFMHLFLHCISAAKEIRSMVQNAINLDLLRLHLCWCVRIKCALLWLCTRTPRIHLQIPSNTFAHFPQEHV